jgi:transcriptional regulator of acetoin/glycerol metabolism
MNEVVARHIDHVISAGTRPAPFRERETLFVKSWNRCLNQHGLDPSRPQPARILPSSQVREHQQRMDGFLRVARAGMEDMYRRVADLGYTLLLTDAEGITVDYIGNPAAEAELKRAGLYLGADWNEAHAGTCGVGTCLIERMPITCHQTEHFDATHIGLTCTSSPLFAPDGQLLGVLDVSALHSPEARESQHLVYHMVSIYAQMIEDANFLRSFGRSWILRLGRACGLVEVSGDVMFAFDEDGVVQGANTGARRWLGGSAGTRDSSPSPVGRPLDELLGLPEGAVWKMAQGGVAAWPAGLWLNQTQHYYPAVIPPRHGSTGAPLESVKAVPTRPVMAGPQQISLGSAPASALDRLCGDDPRMQRLVEQSKRLVDRQVNLLVLGETGSGKEVLAKALHEHSQRRHKPFVAVNCASIPESLIESELFGYTPGSFTGGKAKGMKGLIAQSDGGTLFLDEIGDMPLPLQTRFLRVLAESEVMPLGAEHPIPVKLSVIAATHRGLRDRVEAGTFREDLYYRLSGAVLDLPPLRERQDRSYLIHKIFAEEAQQLGSAARLDAAALDLLQRYPWPGNVRELRNALRFALAMGGDDWIEPADLPHEIHTRWAKSEAVAHGWPPHRTTPEAEPAVTDAGDEGDISAERLLQSLRAHKWSITATAQSLRVCRSTIYRQMKRHQITPPHLL